MWNTLENQACISPLLVIICCIILVACEDALVKEIDLMEDFGHATQLAMSGTLRNDFGEPSSLPITHILLAENQSILDTSMTPRYYQSESLDLYRDGQYFNTFTSSDQGVHRNLKDESQFPTFYIEPGDYRIAVDHPQYGVVSAETQMPAPVNATIIEVIESSFLHEDHPLSVRYEVKVQFRDPVGSNYYEVGVFTDNLSDPDTVFFGLDSMEYSLVIYDSYIESMTLDEAVLTGKSSYIFDDALFNNTEKEFTFSLVTSSNFGSLDITRLIDVTFLKWSCLSEEQYNFETAYLNLQDNQLFGPFSEQYSLFSNVDNGLGYIGAENFIHIPF